MSFIQKAFRNLHPLAQILIIICITITGMTIGAFIALVAGLDGFGVNAIGQVLGFGAGGFIYASVLSDGRALGFNNEFASSKLTLFLLGSVVLALIFSPTMDVSYRLNKWLLVEGSEIYKVAEELELFAFEKVKELLVVDTLTDYALAILFVAVVPAVFEELIFRGALQPLFSKWFGNVHVGIWVSAALFSLIHAQFFGFLPRMILGALFGYLVIWSGSMYTAMLGHFTNNALSITSAYEMGMEWYNERQDPTSQIPYETLDYVFAVLSITATVAILYYLSKSSVWSKNKAIYLTRGQQQDHLSW